MKTPDEIKKGLLCVSAEHQGCIDCAYRYDRECSDFVAADALVYIQQLEAELAAVKRERDALMHDFLSLTREGFSFCLFCNHFVSDEIPCKHAMESGAGDIGDCFEWRGPCAENGGSEDA